MKDNNPVNVTFDDALRQIENMRGEYETPSPEFNYSADTFFEGFRLDDDDGLALIVKKHEIQDNGSLVAAIEFAIETPEEIDEGTMEVRMPNIYHLSKAYSDLFRASGVAGLAPGISFSRIDYSGKPLNGNHVFRGHPNHTHPSLEGSNESKGYSPRGGSHHF